MVSLLRSATPPSSTVPDDAHAARRKYKKDLDFLKPNLAEYKKQRELAIGGLTSFNPQASSSQVPHFFCADPSCCTENHVKVTVSSYEQQLAADNLYRDANTLIYGDNKPSEDAIDRVVEKINKE
jgi:pre-mRNA-splicing factor SYF2